MPTMDRPAAAEAIQSAGMAMSAEEIDRSPDAIARYLLVGCCRSSARSHRSFRRSALDAQAEKARNARSAHPSVGMLIWCDVRAGTNTRVFFAYWWTRNALSQVRQAV